MESNNETVTVQPLSETETSEVLQRAELVRGLRELATFIEQNDVPIPDTGLSGEFTVFVWEKDELAKIVRKLGRAEKEITGQHLDVKKEFAGGIRYVLAAP